MLGMYTDLDVLDMYMMDVEMDMDMPNRSSCSSVAKIQDRKANPWPPLHTSMFLHTMCIHYNIV